MLEYVLSGEVAPQTTPVQIEDAMRHAAQAVLDRWNSPKWDWAKQGPTADLMATLQAALASHAALAAAVEPTLKATP